MGQREEVHRSDAEKPEPWWVAPLVVIGFLCTGWALLTWGPALLAELAAVAGGGR